MRSISTLLANFTQFPLSTAHVFNLINGTNMVLNVVVSLALARLKRSFERKNLIVFQFYHHGYWQHWQELSDSGCTTCHGYAVLKRRLCPGFFFVRTSRYLCFTNFWKTEFLPFSNWVFWKFEGFWAKNVWNCLFWAIFGENFHKFIVLELSFLTKTEFLQIFGIWVIEKTELSFSVLYKKKACFAIILVLTVE